MSPQFHVKFDNTFITTKDSDQETLWQIEAGFVINKHANPPPSNETPPPDNRVTTPSEGGNILPGVALPPAEGYTLLKGGPSHNSERDNPPK